MKGLRVLELLQKDESLEKSQKDYIANERIFLNTYYNYIEQELDVNLDRAKNILDHFLSAKIITKKKKNDFNSHSIPIVICVVKDEIIRIKQFLKHYRKLGINQFAIIDNDSSDGTEQLLQMQDDVHLYSIKDQYSSAKRVAWINKIMMKYGYNRWYLIADSDELINYIGSENKRISELIKYAELKGYKRILGLQVDFYTESEIFSLKDDQIDWHQCKYFDLNTYEIQFNEKCIWYVGGPRKRVLDTYSLLTKYPLIYLTEEDLNISSHYLYPYEKNFITECLLCICHYEFINKKDQIKIKSIVEKEIYASKSKEYKEMYKVIENKNVTFYDKKISKKYYFSKDLSLIKEIKGW